MNLHQFKVAIYGSHGRGFALLEFFLAGVVLRVLPYVVTVVCLSQGEPIIDAARRMELKVGFDPDTSIHLLDAPVFVENELADSCKYLLLLVCTCIQVKLVRHLVHASLLITE